jgi:hypothetical protein
MRQEKISKIYILNVSELCEGGKWSYIKEPEGKFLVREQPHSKLITFSYLIRGELFSTNF